MSLILNPNSPYPYALEDRTIHSLLVRDLELVSIMFFKIYLLRVDLKFHE